MEPESACGVGEGLWNAFLFSALLAVAWRLFSVEATLSELQTQINAQDRTTAEHVRNLYREFRGNSK